MIYKFNNLNISLPFEICQWQLINFFSRKMIFIKSQYKTHNGKQLAIISVLKTWQYNLEGYNYKIFVLIDYNNFYQFLDTKNLKS